jgi:O-antigen/teichoic acid export membrane protein
VISGLKWTTGGRGAQMIIQIVQFAVLARLLTPADFGLFSMTNIIVGLSIQLGDAGISVAIIQSKDMDNRKFSTLYYISLIIGVIIFAGINLTSGLVERFFHTDRLVELLFLGSFIFLIIPVGRQYQTLFQKELMFDTIVKAEFAGKLTGAVVSIILALAGQGVKSLIWGLIADNGLRYFLFLIRGYRLHYSLLPVFRLREVKSEILFGINTMGATMTNYLGSRIDKILIGRFLNEGALGFYEIAYNLVLQPLFNLRPILNRVALPSFAKIQDDLVKVRNYYFNSMEYLNLMIVPAMIGISLTAGPIVLILYGPQWENSIILVEILSLVAMFEVVGDPYRSVLLALGKANKAFHWEIYVTLLYALAIAVAVQFGIVYVAVAHLIARLINFTVKYFWLVRPEFKERVAKEYFIQNLLMQVFYCVPMIVVLLLFNRFVHAEIYVRLALNVVAGVLLYAGMVLLFERNKLLHARSLLRTT